MDSDKILEENTPGRLNGSVDSTSLLSPQKPNDESPKDVGRSLKTVEILDFDLKYLKEEEDVAGAEEPTMELELKVEIESDVDNVKRFDELEASSLDEKRHAQIQSNKINISNNYHQCTSKSQKLSSDHDRPLPPPLISKPLGQHFAPLSPSNNLQPPPLRINPRLSNDDKSHTAHTTPVPGHNSTEEELIKIKKEIRDDIQSELMMNTDDSGGIGNAVAASFMHPFKSAEKRNGLSQTSLSDHANYKSNGSRVSLGSTMSTIGTESLNFPASTTSLLPRSTMDSQIFTSKANNLTSTPSYTNLPLCTPGTTGLAGPRQILGDSSSLLRIDTSSSINYNAQVIEHQVDTRTQRSNGSLHQHQVANKNSLPLLNKHSVPTRETAILLGNDITSRSIGKEVRDRIVRHIEHKNGEVQISPEMVKEMPPLVNLDGGQFSPSPSSTNNIAGRTIHILHPNMILSQFTEK